MLYNQCGFECNLKNWLIKEEGRKNVLVNNSLKSYEEIIIETSEFWTKTGDSFYLMDEENKLVLWRNY